MKSVHRLLSAVISKFFNLGKDSQLLRIDNTTGKGTLAIPEKVVSQSIDTQKEKGMSLLTIHTKNNCYVIDSDRMNHLQQNVANSLTLTQGTYEIKITSGSYKYANAKAEEPFVLLWIYGVDGATFVNQNTGFETGATWTTLNGYHDTLRIEVKKEAVLCSLFFDVNNSNNSGSVELLITSNKSFFNPQRLTVDSKKNCYLLDEDYLTSIKQSGANFIELDPGNYIIKIREGNSSYWSESKKFKLEPWALLWVKGGKFISKLTGVEVEESWFSLNGLADEIVVEVKEKTTLTGLFLDTYKEDNEGEIILAIEPVSATELAKKYKKQGNKQVKAQRQEQTITSETATNIESIAGSVSRETVTNIEGAGGGAVSGEPVSASSSINFSFHFNEDELKKKWEEQLQQINASIKVIDEGGVTLEAKYWDQLEQWLLKNYEKHFKNLAVEVAKVRFTMDAYIEQMDFSLNQQLQSWSGYLDRLMQERINVEISKRINQQIEQYFNQTFEQKIRNNIGLILNNLINKQELNQYVTQHVERQIDQTFERKISNSINRITQRLITDNAELEQYVSRQIDNTYEQKLQERIPVITRNIVNNNEEFNQYIDRRLQQTVTNNTQVNNEIVNLVTNSTEINTKIENLRNEWNQSFINLVTEHADELSNILGSRETLNRVIIQRLTTDNAELEQYVSRQIDNTYEQKLQERIPVITRNIVNNNEEFNQYIDRRLQQTVTNNTQVNNEIVNLVTNSTEINTKIESIYQDIDTKIESIRNEWNQSFISLIRQYVDELIAIIGDRDTFNIRIANLIDIKVNDLLNHIMRAKNELTVLMTNGDRHLYEWTLGELMAIKGCLTDREVLIEQVVSFSTQLRTKLDSTPCVDIKTFQPFKPNLIEPKQQ
jgi:hypothetical protein